MLVMSQFLEDMFGLLCIGGFFVFFAALWFVAFALSSESSDKKDKDNNEL
jgi:hypothetical protein